MLSVLEIGKVKIIFYPEFIVQDLKFYFQSRW